MKTTTIFLFMLLLIVECKTISGKIDDKKLKTVKAGKKPKKDEKKPKKEVMKKQDRNKWYEWFAKEKVEILLNNDIPIDPKELQYLLHDACCYKAYKYIDICLKRGANPNKNKKNNPYSALSTILCRGYNEDMLKSIEVLCKYRDMPNNPLKPDFNVPSKLPTCFALVGHKEEHIKQFLKLGIDIHAVDAQGYNILYHAAELGHYNIIPFLESLGLKWNININPLAKKYGNKNCVIVWEYKDFWTHEEKTHYFVRKGTDASRIKFDEGKSLIHIIAETEFYYQLIFYIVRECGANPNWKDTNGRTFLHNIAFDGRYYLEYKNNDGGEPSINFLSLPGIDLNILDKDGYSFLAYWVTMRRESKSFYMKEILANGANPFFKSPDGYNLIELICMGRFLPKNENYIGTSSKIIPVHYLIDCGVDYRSRNNPEKLTCLELLRKYSKEKIGPKDTGAFLTPYLERAERLDDSGLKISNPELYKKKRAELLKRHYISFDSFFSCNCHKRRNCKHGC